MALAPSTRLGPYEILSPLGAGGMGEVYRARDPRMGREVAIKVSAERFTDRFEREVRAVAALNHSNICQVYDVGPNYLVMELIEGPTLADRIAAGAVPLDEALAIARQIGDALEAAHERGIIHRDLKPANIKIKPDGTAKVLDFGLAKIAEQVAAAGSSEESPTVAMGATIAGQIMGTAAYMAPEQARGQVVDKRADIWAFGVVLCEMLTGRRLFEGETISDTLASVLMKEPDWKRVSAKARRLLQRCLEKDPKRRLRDIADAWVLLDDAPVQPARATRLPWAAAGAFATVSIVAIWAPWRGTVRPIEPATTRLDLDLGPDVSLGRGIGSAVTLSPDGSQLVFVSQGQDGIPRLFTRRLDEPRAVQISGTQGADAPFFSPDGQWVGFFAQGKLKKTRVEGGEPVPLCEANSGRGASWGEAGNIIAALDAQAGLWQVPQEGGNATAITKLNTEVGENTHRWPQVLPGGNAVLFNSSIVYGNYDEAEIAVLTLKDHRRKTLIQRAGLYPRYLASGHLLYVTKGTLFAVPFDLDRLEVRGAARRLMEVWSNPNLGSAQLDYSHTGTLVYRSGGTEGLRTIQWLDETGKTVSLGFEPAFYLAPRFSPDGSHLSYIVSQGSSTDLWVLDLRRGIRTRVTTGQNAYNPVWSHDGQFMVFQAPGGLYWTRADGAGKPQPLTRGKGLLFPNCFTPDGTQLIFSEEVPEGGADIRSVRVESRRGQVQADEPHLLLKTSAPLAFPTVSPDGGWLAYADAAGGSYEVYVRAFPDNGTKVQISSAGGTMPVWSQSEHELFYRTEDQRIMAAKYVVKGGAIIADPPRVWFRKQLVSVGLALNFDLAPDGKRFIVLMPAENPQPRENQSHVMLVTNFFDEVRRRVAGQVK
jgi:serine/threonine-protein kinase